MSNLRILEIKNGSFLIQFEIYKCDRCNKEVQESDAHYSNNKGLHLCWDCSYISGFINEKEYLSCSGINLDKAHASIVDGEIVIWIGETPPWQLNRNKLDRSSEKYKTWRANVFERDKYTCQVCGIRGGILNAHHIKPFAKYKKLRFELDNGITLCKECHRKEHKKKVE